MRTILGLAAKARSGKDTTAHLLLKDARVAAFALANPLKAGCQALFGLSESEAWGDSHKEIQIPLWGKSPREFFQQIGTEWMRGLDANHWLKRAEREINPPVVETQSGATPNLLLPDAPFRLAAQAFFNFNEAQVWGTTEFDQIDSYWGLSPQQAVTYLEQQALELDPDYYRKRSAMPTQPPKALPGIPQTASVIVITDIRFENEAAFLRSHNGVIWHIVRPGVQLVNAHSSEAGIERKPDDIVIMNDGSLDQLEQRVKQAWEQLISSASIPAPHNDGSQNQPKTELPKKGDR
ncbi:deoxynucleotide monophosphate kinase family protein [Pseudomonas inefficax]|uniref:deoxynucleotide monophosphate kinase family protein n=1 Tax=Pseudomonas inefficax TaxID=2078786 RepID=UPI004046BDFC